MIKKYFCVLQHDTMDCAAACLATVSKQYGFKIPIAKIRELADTDRRGTTALGIVNAAEKIGFTAKAIKCKDEYLYEKFSTPVIAHVLAEGKFYHFVVIHKATNKKIIIADPAEGLLTYTPEEFMENWTGVLIHLAPNADFKKGSEGGGIFRRFFKLLIPQRKILTHIFIASMIYVILGIMGSFYFKFLLDDIIQYSLTRTLHIVSIAVICLNIFKIIMGAFRSYLTLLLSQKIDIPLMLGYYNHVVELPMGFFNRRKVGEIISRFMDASKVREAISGATLTIMMDTIMALTGGIILYTQNNVLFGIVLLLALSYGLIVFIFNKPIKKVNQQQMENSSLLTSYLVESLSGIETVKSFNAERQANRETEKRFIKLLRSIFANGGISVIQSSLSGIVAGVGEVVILWVGAYNVFKGTMTIGQVITFNALLVYFLNPIKNLINLQPMMQTAIVAADRLSEILDLELEKSQKQKGVIIPKTLKGDIRIQDLSFRYGSRKLVLNGIDLTIKAGQKIALVGESGSGKTTLVKLLLNFYKWEKGNIYLNDYDLRDIDLEVLREKIAYISQEIFLFNATIKENLLLGNKDVTFDEVVDVCRMSKAHDFINELPLRYDTMIEENGSNLSGGQKQRLAIARALLKKPDIFIMDEATSNLDSIAEKAVERTIEELCKGITTIIIAHRLSTIKKCDAIFVMDRGRIVEVGSHEVLMNEKGVYFNLWENQLSSSMEDMAG